MTILACRRIKMPFGVYDRDLVQYITHRRDEDKKLDYILYKSATDDRCPEQPGLVRSGRHIYNSYCISIYCTGLRPFFLGPLFVLWQMTLILHN